MTFSEDFQHDIGYYHNICIKSQNEAKSANCGYKDHICVCSQHFTVAWRLHELELFLHLKSQLFQSDLVFVKCMNEITAPFEKNEVLYEVVKI